ncbi:hypothetical protein F1649_15715 [Arcticibacter tournemirensis]|uniref:Uncharacterized protein n=1 Tax=Arcticibacter tournemirensis TaxID=699437 RepID=A0A5M9H1A7_9SPHI|nr:hypothetical protein [Arcticibacter tournemirensis]KAA8480069.1 hypothetical protein F1649_15715 [Arcticibacter tournemirensis]
MLLESQSAGPPGFLLSTALYTIPEQVKALRKKIPRERSEQGRFFFSKPEGLALTAPGLCRDLLSKKASMKLLIARAKTLFKDCEWQIALLTAKSA